MLTALINVIFTGVIKEIRNFHKCRSNFFVILLLLTRFPQCLAKQNIGLQDLNNLMGCVGVSPEQRLQGTQII